MDKNEQNTIIDVPLSELHPFKNHPYRVVDDELMQQTIDSIAQVGVLTPAVVRPRDGGGYEIISGHRRLYACQRLGLEKLPVIVKNLTDDEAVIFMVDSNIQRENILPSEKAKAYKMKMEALKHQGLRDLSTSVHVGPKSWTAAKLGEKTGESASKVKRYIKMAELIPELLDKVDEKELSVTPAVELAYLSQDEQKGFLDAMEYTQNSPTLAQAQQIRKLSKSGKCTTEAMRKIMSDDVKSETDRITLETDAIKKYFPRSYTPRQMYNTIIKLLDGWMKKRQQKHNR